MLILSLKIKLHAPWVHSLKEKRMVVKSLLSKMRNKFNVAVAEVGEQDIHQTIVIGVAGFVPHRAPIAHLLRFIYPKAAKADSVMEEIRYFIEESTEAEITDMEREIF